MHKLSNASSLKTTRVISLNGNEINKNTLIFIVAIFLMLNSLQSKAVELLDLGKLDTSIISNSNTFPILDGDFKRALELQKQEKYKEASALYKKLLQKNPGNALAWNNLGLIQQKLRNFSVAETCYMRAIKVAPDDVQAYNNLAHLRYEQADYNGAETTYLKAIELQPDYPLSYSNLASLYKDQGKLFKAVEYYKQAIDKAPITDFYYRLGLLYYEMKKYDDMFETFNDGLKQDPNAPDIYYSLAVAHLYNLLEYTPEKRQAELKKNLNKLAKLSPSKAEEFKSKFLTKQLKENERPNQLN